ncbi:MULTISPECIES: carboxynorspermidine decarboxylase [unclassified Campylobacter]|uniref:carboxynorspermidine decarboxylase n=1 Tax=unclassified Campylobacter TaxID=2593542 RepID=UPI001BD928CF|nr:carboxynorspermidine decarboxylase [Campylobacter sp. 2018MI13]MBT0882264.1 carboxynorspermidine decarboxylase [Campylobacter sp. 2018MI13]MBZ7975825.1 carboxynorspermidine decarboxylase [Campylobacter sp. RM12637]
MKYIENNIKTPAYICYESKLKNNLEIFKKIQEESGVKVLLALKGFAFSAAMPLIKNYLKGCTCSGLWEAKFAKEFVDKEIHTYAPAFSNDDLEEILNLSHHIVINSLNEYKKVINHKNYKNQSLGIRCNLEFSVAPKEIYNPCGKFSRLGIKAKDLLDSEIIVDGLHFHALCEESFESLEKVFKVFEDNFLKPYLAKHPLKWINFGGGHHITKKGYKVEELIQFLKAIKSKYNLEIYLEPGEAIGWQTGDLIASVLDIVENEKKIAILDICAEAHMPDTIIMPYTSEVKNAKILASRDELAETKSTKNSYLLTGNSCLAGDIMGEYEFNQELNIGDKIIFCDQIHYTIVKNTTFNGVKLPSLIYVGEDGSIKSQKEFNFNDYSRRN